MTRKVPDVIEVSRFCFHNHLADNGFVKMSFVNIRAPSYITADKV